MSIHSKVCTKCGIDKPISEYSKKNAKGRKPSLQPRCKTCATEDTRVWYKANKDVAKNTRLQKAYGISLDEYNEMLPTHCPLCNKLLNITDTLGPDSPVVDHCHVAGHVRGIICNECNRGLGYFRDNIQALRNAATYLENSNAFSKKW